MTTDINSTAVRVATLTLISADGTATTHLVPRTFGGDRMPRREWFRTYCDTSPWMKQMTPEVIAVWADIYVEAPNRDLVHRKHLVIYSATPWTLHPVPKPGSSERLAENVVP